MKYTLSVTQQCNLECDYCYIGKKQETVSVDVARAAVDHIFDRTPPTENIDIGFFGGEPLLKFPLIESITSLIRSHPSYDANRVTLSIVTNGTIFDDTIGTFVRDHKIDLCVSADGPTAVHDRYRWFRGGKGSAATVRVATPRASQGLDFEGLIFILHLPQQMRSSGYPRWLELGSTEIAVQSVRRGSHPCRCVATRVDGQSNTIV